MNSLLCRISLLSVLMLISVNGSARAQSEAQPLRGNAMGFSMDRFTSGGSSVVAMSYRYSSLQPGEMGLELGVSVFPQMLRAGILSTASDLGASYNLTVPGGSVLIKAGGSAATAIGVLGAWFVPGVHLGGTLLLQAGNSSGVRLDLIRHHYWVDGGLTVPVWSVGLGFAILPHRQ
ncbi:MAG TPA: hypothetical protein VFH26_03985 [Gemmatimonadales bacterium]|nr:hypothetical protein [Gemmatimonadales bacterium]